MEPFVNLEETPGKVVGKIKDRTPAEAVEWMAQQARAMGRDKLPHPKGVFRFKTFEEADAWDMKYRVAAAAKRLRESQP